MLALRLARGVRARAPLAARARCLATTARPAQAAAVSNTHAAPQTAETPIPLSNVEAQWERLSTEEQMSVHQQLETLQKKDWKELSIDEKKAGALLLHIL